MVSFVSKHKDGIFLTVCLMLVLSFSFILFFKLAEDTIYLQSFQNRLQSIENRLNVIQGKIGEIEAKHWTSDDQRLFQKQVYDSLDLANSRISTSFQRINQLRQTEKKGQK